jgi:hypothetical protein
MGGLDGYLNDHLAGAAAAIRLAERCRARDPDSELGRHLRSLVGEIEEDRAVLERVIEAGGGSPNQVKRATAVGLELLSNLRMSLPMLGPGPPEAARLEEVEALCLGVEGKRLMWRALASTQDPVHGADFESLERRAQAQRDRLEPFRVELARAASRA